MFFLLSLVALAAAGAVPFVPFEMTVPTGFVVKRKSGNSTLFESVLPPNATKIAYTYAPLALRLVGSRKQIGYDYAALMHEEASFTLDTFLAALFPTSAADRALLVAFVDFCWSELLEKNTDAAYLEELAGMDAFAAPAGVTLTSLVAKRFYTLANMPADPVNIISMLEEDLEQGLPAWLKAVINDVVRVLEHAILHTCDAYSVWGPRTTNGQLYSSRNLDYNSNTGINKYKLVTFYQIDNQVPYATIGFSFGMGALAGINFAGVTVSEMNLDNSLVTFQGLAFPLRPAQSAREGHVAPDGDGGVEWHAEHQQLQLSHRVGRRQRRLCARDGARLHRRLSGQLADRARRHRRLQRQL
jgi:hypothetical protein